MEVGLHRTFYQKYPHIFSGNFFIHHSLLQLSYRIFISAVMFASLCNSPTPEKVTLFRLVFKNVILCILVRSNQRSKGICCLNFQARKVIHTECGGSMFLQNTGTHLPNNTVPHPREPNKFDTHRCGNLKSHIFILV